MGKYIKLFETHSAYNTYITGQDKVLPNVSYCEDNNEVHYNPYVETRLIVKFNVTSTSSATNIMGAGSNIPPGLNTTSYFSKIEIDNVIQPSVVTSYTFDTTGEHIVKYTLADPTIIDAYSFNGCTGITNVTIPNSVTSIGLQAFGGCSLTSITIPNSVTSIVNSAFIGCSNLTSIVVNSGNSVYDSRDNCNAIIESSTNKLIIGGQNTIIPNTVTTIGDYCFSGRTGLTSVTIPNSVTTIGQNAFNGCSGLTSVTIPDSVTSIGSSAFNGCTGLTSITIPNTVTSIVSTTFRNCSGLTSLTIGSGVTSIGSQAFNGCSALTSITSLATTAPTIQSSTFQNVKTGGTLYVPSGSDYSTWMGTGNYYLGKYSWTKVEQ